MGNRIIKESICTSETIDQLSWFEETLFYRLIVNCDDYGRFDGRPQILRSRLFPLKNITDKTVSDAINKLSTAGLVMPYTYDGKPTLQLVTWDKHQSVRNQKSKYLSIDGKDNTPACENIRLITIENNRIQLNTNEINCSSRAPNPIQSNPIRIQSEFESEYKHARKPETSSGDTVEKRFDEFWKAYPKKTAKGAAEKAWQKIKPTQELLMQMLKAISSAKQSDQWLKESGQFIPYPATWLNRKEWENKLEIDDITHDGNEITDDEIFAINKANLLQYLHEDDPNEGETG